MPEPKQTLREAAGGLFSAWLFRIYRRPLQFLFVVLVLPLAIVVAATHQASVAMARRQALENLRMTAKVAAEAIHGTLNDAILFAQLVSEDPAFRDAFDRSDTRALQARIGNALPFLPDAQRVVLADANGKTIACVPEASACLGKDLSGEEAFQSVRERRAAVVSPVGIRDEESFEKVVKVAAPIILQERLAGLFIVEYRIESIRLWVQHVRVEPEGFLYAVDQAGQLAVYPFQVLPGRPKVVREWEPVAQPISPEGFSIMFRDRRAGRQWLAGVFPVGRTGWRAVAVQPDDAILRVFRRAFLPMGVLILVLLALVLFVSVRWAALQALNFRLLQQNAKLLKRSQQRWTLEQGKSPKDRQGGVSA